MSELSTLEDRWIQVHMQARMMPYMQRITLCRAHQAMWTCAIQMHVVCPPYHTATCECAGFQWRVPGVDSDRPASSCDE